MIQPNFLTKTLQLVLIVTLAGLMIAAGVGLIPLPPLWPGPEAHAAGTINVTTTGDEYNTSGNGSGCALREAIESVNTSSSFGGCSNPGNAADTIQLQAMTYTLSITETGYPFTNVQGSLKPQESMIIRGIGGRQTIISTTLIFNDRVFDLSSYATNISIAIEKVTIRGGKSSGIYVGLFGTSSTFTLTNAILENNQSIFSGGALICAGGTSNLNEVIIRNNQVTDSDGRGGGLALGDWNVNVNLNNVTLYGNQADLGGAIYISGYTGVFPTLQMTNVTIYDNQAQISGGGFYLNFLGSASISTEATATNVTFANNRALSGSGGNIYNNAAILSLKNTIIANGLANGSPNNCGGNPVPNITSLGHNLDSGNTCGLTATGDITNTNPLLAASLADNGGSAETLALLAGSPAINSGTCSGAPATDQRGVTRPQGSSCDIGAYEAGNQPNFPVYLPTIRKH
jgi:CSLREA domain-containing protein